MDGMFEMAQRMTIWAQNFYVLVTIVLSVFIFVVYPENFWYFTIAASGALFYFSSSLHRSSEGAAEAVQRATCLVPFNPTRDRAKYSILRWRFSEFTLAVFAFYWDRMLVVYPLSVAFSRAIFCYLLAEPNNLEIGSTYRAFQGNAIMFVMPIPKAFSRAIEFGVLFPRLAVDGLSTPSARFGGACARAQE